MRILWSSNSLHVPTGYGVETRLFLPRLRNLGHEVAGFFWYGTEGAATMSDGILTYPKGGEGTYGNDRVAQHAQSFQADLVITLIDAWVLDPKAHRANGVKWAPYFPVDSEPIPPPVLSRVKEADFPIVYSAFGRRMAEDAGLSVSYVPHAVDTTALYPIDRRAARDFLSWPQDRFIVGMVAANKGFPSRKSYPEQLEAFAYLAQKHSDALLYVHTNQDGMGGLNMPEFCDMLSIGGRTIFADQYKLITGGWPDEYMRAVYSACDVLLSTSMGEGFGIPILESQACGTPVIVGNWTAMAELCFGGWKVPREYTYVDGYGTVPEREYNLCASYQYRPRIGDVLAVLEHAYNNAASIDRAALAARARAYDVETIVQDYWRPVLSDIAARMGLEQPEPLETLDLVGGVAR